MTSTSTPAPARQAGAALHERAVLDVLDGFYAAWATGDADAMARLYTRDATVVMPGVYHRGRDQVRDWFAAAFAGRLKGSSPIDESRTVRFPSADAATVVSQGGIVMAGEASLPAERAVRATWVLARQDGNWLVTAYHNCQLHAG